MKPLGRVAKRHIELVYFGLLSLLIIAPLLGNGYTLTLDMIFSPQMNFAIPNHAGLYNELPRDAILFVSSKLIPAWLVEQLVLFGIFFAAGFFMYELLVSLRPRYKILAFAAATLYVINPFTYTRLLAGQWAFLIGYALTPLFIRLLRQYFSGKKFSNTDLIMTVSCWFLVSLVSIHHLILFGMITFCYLAVLMFTRRKWSVALGRAFILAAAVALLSLSWLLPSILINDLRKLDSFNLQYFASVPDLKYGLTFNLASFYGFWAERTLGIMPKEVIPAWWLVFSILAAIAGLPLVRMVLNLFRFRKFGCYKRSTSVFLLVILIAGVAGLVLAHGNIGFMQGFWDLFYNRIPLLQPMRESEKFLSIYLLGFVIFLFYGLIILRHYLRRLLRKIGLHLPASKILLFGIIFLTGIYTPTMALAAHNQLEKRTYPDAWYSLEDLVEHEPTTTTILVLPWQAYNTLNFTGRQTAEPAESFFAANVLQAQLPRELSADTCDLQYSGQLRGIRYALCLNNSDSKEDWISQILGNGVNYVMVHKAKQTEQYPFLEQQHFQVISDDSSDTIYKVK